MNLVEILINNLMALLPFVIILSYQRGIRWRFGKNPIELQPGFHWKFWIFHQIEIMNVVDEAIELPTQSVITADEKLVCFSANIGFRINDVVKHNCGVQDFHESVLSIAMTHLAKRVREERLEDLIKDLKKLEKSLEGTLTTRLTQWGTEVFSVGFTNFAEVPQQIRLFTDGHGIPALAH